MRPINMEMTSFWAGFEKRALFGFGKKPEPKDYSGHVDEGFEASHSFFNAIHPVPDEMTEKWRAGLRKDGHKDEGDAYWHGLTHHEDQITDWSKNHPEGKKWHGEYLKKNEMIRKKYDADRIERSLRLT